VSAERAARQTAAAAVWTDFEHASHAHAMEGATVPDWATWAQRLSIALASLLDEPPAAAPLDSESWTCTACGGLFIGGRIPGDVCGECQAAGPVLLAEVVDGLRAEVVDAIDVALACSRAARQLGAIRAALARVLDSEHGDRQMALEEIDRIATPGGES
jgi:hypothetical protein